MEVHQPTLQLLFNVMMITAVTSVSAFGYLLRRTNKQLTSELTQRQRFKGAFAENGVDLGSPVDSTKEQHPKVATPVYKDIREFVAHRSQAWQAASTGRKASGRSPR